jgi:hypothetical protein
MTNKKGKLRRRERIDWRVVGERTFLVRYGLFVPTLIAKSNKLREQQDLVIIKPFATYFIVNHVSIGFHSMEKLISQLLIL